jgi:hypothetical protein
MMIGGMKMRKIKLNLVDLADAFESESGETKFYFDLETGAVTPIDQDTRTELNAIYAAIGGELDADGALFAAALQTTDLPDWQKVLIQQADLVECNIGTRFVEVPQTDSRAGYHDMEAFIETVQGKRLQDRLSEAINGRGAFRRFKDALLSVPDERERWFAFKGAVLRQRAKEWLESLEIEPIEE